MTVLDSPEDIAFAQMVARRGALRMEVAGMHRSHGRSAYSICKSEYGLRGTKASVLAQMTTLIEKAHAERAKENA